MISVAISAFYRKMRTFVGGFANIAYMHFRFMRQATQVAFWRRIAYFRMMSEFHAIRTLHTRLDLAKYCRIKPSAADIQSIQG